MKILLLAKLIEAAVVWATEKVELRVTNEAKRKDISKKENFEIAAMNSFCRTVAHYCM
jgi:hypothetical protein